MVDEDPGGLECGGGEPGVPLYVRPQELAGVLSSPAGVAGPAARLKYLYWLCAAASLQTEFNNMFTHIGRCEDFKAI